MRLLKKVFIVATPWVASVGIIARQGRATTQNYGFSTILLYKIVKWISRKKFLNSFLRIYSNLIFKFFISIYYYISNPSNNYKSVAPS